MLLVIMQVLWYKIFFLNYQQKFIIVVYHGLYYINPEIAHVRQNIEQAQTHGATLLKLSYQSNDRVVASLATDRLIKVAVNKKGYILGATIIG